MPRNPRKIRLLLVDDHELIRTSLGHLLAALEFQIVGDVGTLSGCIEQVARLQPDIVLMESRMADGDALRTCREIRAAYPEVRVMFLTSAENQDAMLNYILAGGDAYLSKNIAASVLTDAIVAVASGQPKLDFATMQRLRERISCGTPQRMQQDALSPQERRILPLVAEGKTNKEIGKQLGLSDKTVKNHLSSVYQKLQVKRRAQVAALVAHDRSL
ncbi:LuxR C-terminal-related transcriptional regulator [Noviherbaspirillum saxi]|uniref:DNA-binding response regulator n=1 Tax=Noviherbaspirillum saxi TaxID=2320863 RepID=A0A3A3FI95_9BURK|nr:response regulator transcription factor [Noviherbaspirillum saxi]RJF92254.1 DNA-binding response regulator [Noviherbaspirillum saxi]